jgi:hypothetical protein
LVGDPGGGAAPATTRVLHCRAAGRAAVTAHLAEGGRAGSRRARPPPSSTCPCSADHTPSATWLATDRWRAPPPDPAPGRAHPARARRRRPDHALARRYPVPTPSRPGDPGGQRRAPAGDAMTGPGARG